MKKLRVRAKVAKPTRQRIKGLNYWSIIRGAKTFLDLPYSTIADWMGITTSNLTSMISQQLNPYPAQWMAFIEGLKNYENNPKRVQVWVNVSQIKLCDCGCDNTFLLGSPITRRWFNKNKCRR